MVSLRLNEVQLLRELQQVAFATNPIGLVGLNEVQLLRELQRLPSIHPLTTRSLNEVQLLRELQPPTQRISVDELMPQ